MVPQKKFEFIKNDKNRLLFLFDKKSLKSCKFDFCVRNGHSIPFKFKSQSTSGYFTAQGMPPHSGCALDQNSSLQ